MSYASIPKFRPQRFSTRSNLHNPSARQCNPWLCPGIRPFHSSGGHLPIPPPVSSLESEIAEARSWIAQFRGQLIPKSLVDLTFSRSSGPGGQNVNKVNTKATLRCSVDANWIPMWARTDLRKSPFYASSSQSLVITSTLHRSQAQNVEDCLSKLHALILSTSAASVKNEPSEEQQKRVVDLEKVQKQRRMKEKMQRSATKQGRARGKRGGCD